MQLFAYKQFRQGSCLQLSAKINSRCKKIINTGILNNIKSTVSKHSLGLCDGNTQLSAIIFFVTLSKQGYAYWHAGPAEALTNVSVPLTAPWSL